MDRIKDYDIFGIEVDVIYFTTQHGDKSFPRVKDIFHKDVRITDIIDHHIIEKVESEIFRGLNDIVST